MKNTNLETETKNTQRKASILFIGQILIITVMLMLVGLAYFWLDNLNKKTVALKQEERINVLAASSQEKIIGIATKEAERLKQIVFVFPDSERILTTLKDLEKLVKAYDETSRVSFETSNPVKVGGELSIPILLEINTKPSNGVEILRRVERMPYLIKVEQVIFEEMTSYNDLAKIEIRIRLYVADPFNKLKK